MAKILDELEAFLDVGEEKIRFVFRTPTSKEENEFERNKTFTKRNQVKNNSFSARVTLFDLLFEKIENLTKPKEGLLVGRDEKPLTKETINLLPNKYKSDLILYAYEDTGTTKDKEGDEEEAGGE